MIPLAPFRRKGVLWLLIGAGLLVVGAANAHLVYIAASSQPDCVAHVRAGDATAQGRFSAAKSSCSSSMTSSRRAERVMQ